MRIEYFFYPNTYIVKENEVSQLSVGKQIEKICAAADVTPGTYTRKDATTIVWKIQKIVVNCFEKKSHYDFVNITLHNFLKKFEFF